MGSATGDRLAKHLPDQADWLVPTVVQLELAKWLTREVGEDKGGSGDRLHAGLPVIPLDTEIALEAAEACRMHKLATANAIVFATARSRRRPS